MDSPLTIALIILGVVAVGFFVAAIVLIVKLLKLYSAVKSGAMPLQGKVAFWAALIYGISPVDLLPAPVYLDDVAILAGAVAYVGNLARKYVRVDHGPRDQIDAESGPKLHDQLKGYELKR
ncbi:hypothetical protein JQS43_09735 [Natronosporangium hydrolyticum]|uniref:DUF1232 domain-containing protein n=1 Tax=Natronosporangium hydrolyticum TaxID=2811111 RepID=A0A895YMI5_9ACTN|nr:hypothetical protein [Natronosporangium hydrolyticum]QSB16523.1 hypothetical protein JQS43_09735 [Natronosporangium hydrolyticum]